MLIKIKLNILRELIRRELTTLNLGCFSSNTYLIGWHSNMQIQLRVTRDKTEFIKRTNRKAAKENVCVELEVKRKKK
jgi:hypothetical protein